MAARFEYTVAQLKKLCLDQSLPLSEWCNDRGPDFNKYDAYFYLNEKGDPVFVVEQLN